MNFDGALDLKHGVQDHDAFILILGFSVKHFFGFGLKLVPILVWAQKTWVWT